MPTRGAGFCKGAGPFVVGVGSHGAALGGRPRRPVVDMLGARRFPSRGATLDIDFVNQQAYAYGVGTVAPGDLIAYTGSGGTVVNSAGVLVPASGLRYDYDPVTLACKGAMAEGQNTNGFTQSGNLAHTDWPAATNATKAAASGIAPDGTNAYTALVEDSTNNQHLQPQQSITQVVGQVPAVSVFAKELPGSAKRYLGLFCTTVNNGNTGNASAIVDLATGIVTLNIRFTSVTVETAKDGAWRVTAVAPACTVAASLVFRWHLCNASGVQANQTYTGDGVSGVLLWGGQYEAGTTVAASSSYTPTTTAAVTRTADHGVILGIDSSLWFNQSEGTFYVEADQRATSQVNTWFQVSAGAGSSDRMRMITNTTGLLVGSIDVAAVNQANMVTAGSVSPFVASKAALAYKSADFGTVRDGGSIVTAASGNVPALMTQINFGEGVAAGLQALGGHLKRLRYVPRRITNGVFSMPTLP